LFFKLSIVKCSFRKNKTKLQQKIKALEKNKKLVNKR
jgi:hypothetical protein